MNTSNKELRVHHDQLYTLPSLFLEDYDTICLGHSGCIHKMVGLAEEHIQYILQPNGAQKKMKMIKHLMLNSLQEQHSHLTR